MRNVAAVMTAVLAGHFLMPAPAQALTILRADSFSVFGPVAIVGVPEFDPALGTLDRVTVQIDGVFSLGYLLPPLAVIGAPSVNLDVAGAARGFDLSGGGAQFLFAPVSNPSSTLPIAATVLSTFQLSFSLDAATDIIGFAFASVSAPGAVAVIPPLVDAQRSDFVEGIAAIGISETLILSPSGFAPTSSSFGGALIVTYDYTPAPAPAIPAPPPLVLLAAAPLLLAARRRR